MLSLIQVKRQLGLEFRSWGGARQGAGRKRGSGRAPGHARRAKLSKHTPVHVTLRAVHEVRCLRAQVYFAMVRSMIARSQRADFRVVHFSVQGNHIHLICEASDGRALGRGMQWLSSMIARGVNFTRGRRGPVWRERYHRTDLGSPRRVRNALRYVLMNHDKHGPQDSHTGPLLDPCSSALWFDGWSAGTRPAVEELARAVRWGPPVVAPASWLLRLGWRGGVASGTK